MYNLPARDEINNPTPAHNLSTRETPLRDKVRPLLKKIVVKTHGVCWGEPEYTLPERWRSMLQEPV